MTSTTGYDQNLLASAPEVTGARRQEGYTTDLLNTNSGKATPPLTTQSDLESGLVAKEYNQPAARPIPFWRTRKGMIIIFIAGIVVLGAVIGGAVGGTAGKKDPKGVIPQGAIPSSSPDVGGGGGGGALIPGKAGSTQSGGSPSLTPPGVPSTTTSSGAAPNPTTSSTGAGITTGSNSQPPTVATPNSEGKDGGQTGGTLFGGLIVGAERAGFVEHI